MAFRCPRPALLAVHRIERRHGADDRARSIADLILATAALARSTTRPCSVRPMPKLAATPGTLALICSRQWFASMIAWAGWHHHAATAAGLISAMSLAVCTVPALVTATTARRCAFRYARTAGGGVEGGAAPSGLLSANAMRQKHSAATGALPRRLH